MTRRWLWPALTLLVVIAAILSVGVGAASIPPARALAALAGQGDPVERAILIELRLPRAILGLAVGAMLGLGGAALQGYLRNPLAEPYVLGVSSGASTGAAAAMVLIGMSSPLGVASLAFVGALVATTLVLGVGGRRGSSALTLVLAGIAVGFIFQEPTLLAWRSVRGNVELCAEIARLPRGERRRRAQAAIDAVGLTGFESQLPRMLSGGMKMRASLAPRARTTWTKGWARTSSMERMSTCMSGAAMGTARVSVGRISPSSGVGSTTLTQPRRKEKNCSSRMAIQNPGSETINDGRERTTLRSAPAPGSVEEYAQLFFPERVTLASGPGRVWFVVRTYSWKVLLQALAWYGHAVVSAASPSAAAFTGVPGGTAILTPSLRSPLAPGPKRRTRRPATGQSNRPGLGGVPTTAVVAGSTRRGVATGLAAGRFAATAGWPPVSIESMSSVKAAARSAADGRRAASPGRRTC